MYMSVDNYSELKFDIEVSFDFIGFRKDYIYEGYRPLHLICPGVLLTGYHHYYNLNRTIGKLEGAISFIAADLYPESMWVGKKIEMYDNNVLVGRATVSKILNPILESHETKFSFNSIT